MIIIVIVTLCISRKGLVQWVIIFKVSHKEFGCSSVFNVDLEQVFPHLFQVIVLCNVYFEIEKLKMFQLKIFVEFMSFLSRL